MELQARAFSRACRWCLAAVGLMLALSGPARADVAFVAASSLSLGGLLGETARGDFNEDGQPDLAVVDRQDNTVRILLNTGGAAGFSAAGSFGVGAAPYGLVAADFNGDGHLDIAVASFNEGTVTVRLGDGHGGLSAANAFGAGPNPYGLAVADFDGDGRLDVAVAVFSGAAKGVSVLWGDGTGRLDGRPRTEIGMGVSTTRIVSGDWNEDGHADIVVGSGDGVFWLRGDGAGGFAAAQRLTGDEYVPFVAVGDANGDGHLDILALVQNTSASPILLTGDGTGNFSRRGVGSPGWFSSAAIVDATGDGRADLVLARSSGTVVVWPGLAGGGFGFNAGGQEYSVGDDESTLAVADFNGDGHPDIAVANGWGGRMVRLLGDGAGRFAAARSYGIPERDARAVAVADFNEDGRIDLAVAYADESSVWILRGDGQGGFVLSTRLDTGAQVRALAAGDLDGDGHADLAVVSETDRSVMVYLGRGAGDFSLAGQGFFTGLSPRSIVTGTFRGPGYPAHAAVWALETTSSLEAIRWVGVTPQGAVDMLDMTVWQGVRGFAPVDVNQDGRTDLVAATSAGTVGTSLSAASQPLEPVYLPVSAGPLGAVAGWGVAGRAGVFTAAGTQIASLAAAPGQALGVVGQYGAGLAAKALAAADFDGDGLPDVVGADASGGIAILRGQAGVGALGLPVARFAGGTAEQMAVADFNGDGRPDVAIANGIAGITVLMNASPSADAALASLALSQGVLSPAFQPQVAAYAAGVPHAVTALSLTPVAADAGASITVNGTPVASGSATPPLALVPGTNVIQVEVLAQNGVARRTYTITVVRDQTVRHAVTALAGSGGSIGPAGTVDVAQGQTQAFTVTPGAGYRIASVAGCGGSLAGSSYTTAAVTAACTVQARFETLPTPTNTGSGPVNVGVVDGSTGCQLDLAGTGPVAAPAPYPGATLPHGAFRLRLIHCQPGETVRVAVTFPDLTGFTVKKYGPTPDSPSSSRYYDPVNLQISGNTVTYDVTDGGWGDDSFGAQDGTINDPVVPVLLAPGPVAIPTLSAGGLGGLAALLGLLALRGGRRTALRAHRAGTWSGFSRKISR